MINMWSSKTFRRILPSILFFIPQEKTIAMDRWLRGRKEYQKLKKADCVIVSYPKSGRTWLRVMISRFYQNRYDLDEKAGLLGFDNYHRINPDIPRIFFTHDNVLRDYSKSKDSRKDYYDKKVIFLVRDPRDVAVSQFFQWKYRTRPEKKRLYSLRIDEDDKKSLFESTIDTEYGLPKIIDFLNTWERELPNIASTMVIRYEDMRAAPEESLARIMEFIGTPGSEKEIRDTVSYAAFENLKKLEQAQAFGTRSSRMTARDRSNPNAYKVRRAKIGGYRDYYTDEELAWIERLMSETLSPSFNYKANGEDAMSRPLDDHKEKLSNSG